MQHFCRRRRATVALGLALIDQVGLGRLTLHALGASGSAGLSHPHVLGAASRRRSARRRRRWRRVGATRTCWTSRRGSRSRPAPPRADVRLEVDLVLHGGPLAVCAHGAIHRPVAVAQANRTDVEPFSLRRRNRRVRAPACVDAAPDLPHFAQLGHETEVLVVHLREVGQALVDVRQRVTLRGGRAAPRYAG
jgi:hypothetical protein